MTERLGSGRRPLVTNLADDRERSNAKRLIHDHEARIAAAARAVLALPQGRLLVWELLASTGIHTRLGQFAPDLAYAAGKHDLGIEWRERLFLLAPQEFVQMEADARERATRVDSQLEAFDASRRVEAAAAHEESDGA